MSKIGEFVLGRLSRDPQETDYSSDFIQKYQDINAYTKDLVNTFPAIKEAIADKSILDIGCSGGLESLAIAQLGARKVVGIDIRIDIDRANALREELCPHQQVDFFVMDAHQMTFPGNTFDVVVSCGSFEHFKDPRLVLKEAKRVLKKSGRIFLSSGVWSHPYGAHMHFFTRVPWVQFFFSERTIMNVRSHYRDDGAREYSQVEGGLNKIGIRGFQSIYRELGLNIDYLLLQPVKGLRVLTKIPFLNEFFTNSFVAIMRKQDQN
jgi:ubiquinone/menaquinone biosynthesis C-methylase UbiE